MITTTQKTMDTKMSTTSFEDYDSEWIYMSDILEDLTFEEPELACILENLQKGRKGSGKYHRKGRKGFGKGEFRDKEGGKGNRPENYKQVRLKLQGDRLNSGWRDQSTRATYKGRYRPQFADVGDFLTRTRGFLVCRIGASCEKWFSEKGRQVVGSIGMRIVTVMRV